MLLGRGAYEYFQPTWPQAEGPYMDRINAMRKLVFSDSLEAVDWSNAELVRGDAVDAVRGMEGRFVVYGYTRLAQSLLAAGLVDELDFAVHPLVLTPKRALTLVAAEAQASGVVCLLALDPAREDVIGDVDEEWFRIGTLGAADVVHESPEETEDRIEPRRHEGTKRFSAQQLNCLLAQGNAGT